jgi:hypothetical protein
MIDCSSLVSRSKMTGLETGDALIGFWQLNILN